MKIKSLNIESLSGILLIVAAVMAMIIKNSGGAEYYNQILASVIQIRAESFSIEKPFLLWVNDGLMAIFFFAIGLELKKEFLIGKLSDRKTLILPTIAAVGGVVVPALIYLTINFGNELSLHGWAIPTATDIAFALAVISLLGSRVPASLKLFLMTLAIIDDLVGILIIAFFYTQSLSMLSLGVSLVGFIALFILNRSGVKHVIPYLIVGFIIWVCFLKSGVHATIAGVLNAFFIPLARPTTSTAASSGHHDCLLSKILHGIHPYVALGVLPLFAFVNAGIDISSTNMANFVSDVPLGIFLGLVLGKQVGVFGFSFLAIKLKLCQLPHQANWVQLYGTSVLCGIGFTMSLFIASLAFEHGGAGEARIDRLAIIVASVVSAVWGVAILFFAKPLSANQRTDKA